MLSSGWIINTIITAANIFCRILLLFFFLHESFEENDENRTGRLIYIPAFSTAACVLELAPSMLITRIICMAGGTFLFVYLFYETTFREAAATSLTYYSIYILTTLISEECICGIFHLSFSAILQIGIFHSIALTISNLILAALILLILSFRGHRLPGFDRAKTFIPDSGRIFPLILCQAASVVLCFSVLFQYRNRSVPVWVTGYLALLLFMNIAFLFYASSQQDRNSKEKASALADQKAKLQEDYYEKLHAYQEETRAMYHDIQKYILAMEAVSASSVEKDSKESREKRSLETKSQETGKLEILQNAREMLMHMKPVVDVDNDEVSAILDYYVSQASGYGISCQLNVSVPGKLSISMADLCIIIGNTFDNAIEACLGLSSGEKRWIRLSLRKVNEMLYYNIQNPYQAGEKQIHNRGKYHGYGLRNVKERVKRYEGVFSTDADDAGGIYSVTVRINLP